jgi:hypothetical protein
LKPPRALARFDSVLSWAKVRFPMMKDLNIAIPEQTYELLRAEA